MNVVSVMLEKEINNFKWYKKGNLKIRVKDANDNSIIWVTLDGYNICAILVMYDFIDRVGNELLLDISINKIWNGQRAFLVNSEYNEEFIEYITEFIIEWNIEISEDTVTESDLIKDGDWYSIF